MNEHWNLEDIYPSEQAWSEDLAATRQLVDKLCAMQGRVCQDGHTLLEALDLNARCSERFAKLFTYANCHYDAEMANPGYKKLYETIFGENSAAAQRTALRARFCPSKGIQVRAASAAHPIPRGISTPSRGRYPAHRAARAKAKEKMASRRMGSPPLSTI